MSISAAEAAKVTGRTKQAVIAAIKSGKISAIKDVDGAWQIEPVELFRYYQPVSNFDTNGHVLHTASGQAFDSQVDAVSPSFDGPSNEALRVEVKLLREMLAEANDQVTDLRRRLDASTAQVDQMAAVMAQLTPPKAKMGWWQRLLGG